ncbi:MAG: 4-hydroxy-tetrahydrodipicolinate synthase [Candidatus Adiutrix sp.]|jgi:4-hydroxy-tetrahydrodipicolinate synthase|nr:4-hydroxy-tetrahydrodipicolinate synthase [Candidatus Adiutrix sp.]
MKGLMFAGVITALATPFHNGDLDEDTLRRHIRFQIRAGVQGLVPCGTTGESPTLTYEEHKRVISIAVEEARGQVKVLAGAGSNSTREAIEFAEHAARAGADGLLAVTPYYNKPTQEGIFQHYQALARAVDLPIMLYNIPGRCGVNITPDTMARLAREIPAIVGVKEATGDLNQVIRTLELCGPDFLVTSGDDGLCLPIWSVGGGGVISVASNLIPGPVVTMWRAWEAGQAAETRALFFKMLPLFKALFLETNPMPLKAALNLAGLMGGEMRLPMCQPQAATLEALKPLLKDWGLL